MSSKESEYFPVLDADDENNITEIESLCMKCHENGITKLMLTKIPFFREVIISSFSCPSCHHQDNSVQSGGTIQDRGVKYILDVTSQKELNRQVIKSEFASLFIPQIEFEQPASKRGDVSTVEGLLSSVITGLNYLQEERRKSSKETAEKIDRFLEKLESLKIPSSNFTLILDDPSGNSFIENPEAPHNDKMLTIQYYHRNKNQNILIGCLPEEEYEIPDSDNNKKNNNEKNEESKILEEEPKEKNWNFKQEVMSFPTVCTECNKPCQTNMKMVDIPFFKQVVIMATVCDACGYRDNEVKGGVGVEPKGQTISLLVSSKEDLNRDVLKSDTAGVRIPELDFEMVCGSLGGRFTTIEGLLLLIKNQLGGENPFLCGDSSDNSTRGRILKFCEKIDQILDGTLLYIHLILDDPAGNSYIQNFKCPEPDPHLTIHFYERNYQQNEELGLNDINTENYKVTSS